MTDLHTALENALDTATDNLILKFNNLPLGKIWALAEHLKGLDPGGDSDLAELRFIAAQVVEINKSCVPLRGAQA